MSLLARLPWFKKPPPPLEEQLATLRECGLALAPGAGLEDVRAAYDGLAGMPEGYLRLLVAIGNDTVPLSADVLHVRTRCVHGTGAYVHLLGRLVAMLPDEFPARDIADDISLPERRGAIAFEIGDTRHHWSVRVLDDWLDETLLVRVNHLIEELGGVRTLKQVPLGADELLIVAATAADSRKLAQRTRLPLREIV